MGAVVAYEMVVSGAFTGPVVLLGISLSSPDEPRFFRAIIRLGSFLGTLPMRVLKKGLAYMAKHAPVPQERQAELQADFARNNTHDMLGGLQAYDTEGRLSGPRDRRSRVGHGRGRASTSALPMEGRSRPQAPAVGVPEVAVARPSLEKKRYAYEPDPP
jgi:hypothetical protein